VIDIVLILLSCCYFSLTAIAYVQNIGDRLSKINQPAIAYPSHKKRSPLKKINQIAIAYPSSKNSDRPSKKLIKQRSPIPPKLKQGDRFK